MVDVTWIFQARSGVCWCVYRNRYYADEYGSVNGGRDTDISGAKVCVYAYLYLYMCVLFMCVVDATGVSRAQGGVFVCFCVCRCVYMYFFSVKGCVYVCVSFFFFVGGWVFLSVGGCVV